MSDIEPKVPEPQELAKIDPPKIPFNATPNAPALLDCTSESGATAATVKRSQQAWADYLGVPVETSVDLGGGVKMEFVLIPK